MIKIFEEHKKYIIPAILLSVYIIFTVFTWGRWGHAIADCFREAIIPQTMLDGKVLYSDITCIYPPLAYQFNALLFKIFGNSLNVLYFSGIICSLTVLTLLYKIAEKKASLLTTFVLILTIMEIFTFRMIRFNSASWYFPYSYSFLYAFVFGIIAVYLYFLFRENNNKKYLYLSTLSTGISVACKFDFLLLILLVVYELIKRKSFKDFGCCLVLFFAPLLCSYGIWFLTGGSVDGLVQYRDFLVNFANAPSVKGFNENILMQSFSEKTFIFLNLSVRFFVINIFKILCLSFVMIFLFKKIKNLFLKILSLSFFIIFTYFMFLTKIGYMQLHICNLHTNLLLIPYIVLVSAIIIFLYKIKERNYSEKEKFYFLITSVAFLMSYRLFMAVFISYIGNFIMVVYWFAFLYLLFELLPEYIPYLQKDLYKKLVCITLILYGFTFTLAYLSLANKKIYKIDSSRGIFYTTSCAKIINSAISYIKENTKETDTVLVMDEGLIINYFADRRTNLKYYALIPHMVDTYGEEKIISDLSQNPPDYVIITNNMYPFIGYFGINYAQKILQYVFDNYDYVQSYKDEESGKGLEVTIFIKK